MNASRRQALTFALGNVVTLTHEFGNAASAIDEDSLTFLYSDIAAQSYQVVADALRARHPNSFHTKSVERATEDLDGETIVCVGTTALTALASTPVLLNANSTILSVFANRNSVNRIARGQFFAPAKLSGIYAETSPVSNLNLIPNIFKRPASVSCILSKENAGVGVELLNAAKGLDIELQIVPLEEKSQVHRLLASVQSDALLAVPDSLVFTPENVQTIFESCYRKRQAVVGYVPSMVQAGAIATTYATTQAVLRQLDEQIVRAQTAKINAPEYPYYWQVATNERLARSLNIEIPISVKDATGSSRTNR